jgi:hypothetical protein
MTTKELEGKVIEEASWIIGSDGCEEKEGFGQLLLKFTDGSQVIVNYSCMGGVYLSD